MIRLLLYATARKLVMANEKINQARKVACATRSGGKQSCVRFYSDYQRHSFPKKCLRCVTPREKCTAHLRLPRKRAKNEFDAYTRAANTKAEER